MPIRGTDPLASAYQDTFVDFGSPSEESESSGYIQPYLQDPYVFLYPEASGGQQYEVWQNRATGEFQYRNFSSLPSAPTAPTPTISMPRTPSFMGESEDEAGTPYTIPNFPVPQQPSTADDFFFDPIREYLNASGLPQLAGALVEPFAVARAGGPSSYGRDLGPISEMLNQAQDFAPILSTAPAAAEALFGYGARTAASNLGRSLLRSSEAFKNAAMVGRQLAVSEQGAVPFMRLVPSPDEATVSAARSVLSNLDDLGVPSLADDIKSRAFTALNTDATPEERLLEAGRILSESLPSGRPSLWAGDEYSLLRHSARKQGLPAVSAGGRIISTMREVFHGTASPTDFAKLAPQRGRPIFVSESPWYAGNYMGASGGSRRDMIGAMFDRGNPRMIKAFLKPNAKIVDGEDVPEEIAALGLGFDEGGEQALLRWMQDNNIDAVRWDGGKEIAVSNPDALLYDEYVAPGIKELFADEGGFLNFGKQSRLSPQTQQALGGAKSLTWSDITRAVQERATNRIAGIERAARHINDTELKQVVDEFNQVGSVVTKAAERSRIVYEQIADIAARAGVRADDMPLFQEDVSKYLYAQTAATWRKLHPRAIERPFGDFATSKEAAQWLTNYSTAPANAEVSKAARVVADEYVRIRDALYAAGGLSKKQYTELTTNYPWYNPLKYTNIANDAALGNADAMSTIGALRTKIHELADDVPTHGNVVNPMEAVFLSNNANERFIANNNFIRKSLDVLRRDPDLAGQVRKLQPHQTHNPDIERAVVMFENGAVQRWAVPKWAAGEIEHTVAHDADNEIIGFVNTLNKWWRTGAIEQNPAFIATNFILDHLNAYARAGTVPGSALGEMVRYLRGANTDDVMRTFRLAGAEQSKFFSNATREEKLKLARSLQTEANRHLDLADPEAIRQRIFSFLPNMGRATEQGQRLKAFENSMDKALPNWKRMNPIDAASTPQAKRAATDALESIINYHRGGWLTRNLDRLMPFTNVAVQGTLLPLRIAQTPQGRARLASLAGLWTGLSWYNNTYPENADVPAYIRYGTLYVMLPTEEYTVDGKPKPNYIVLSPALRDLVPLKGISEVLIENFISHSPTAGHGIAAQILANAPTGVGPGPILDLASSLFANYNMFRGEPVVPESEQTLPKPLQYGIATPRTYKELGSLTNQSPRQLQAIGEGVGTGPAKLAVGVSDWILDTFMPEAKDKQITDIVAKLSQVAPEDRELILTQLPSTLREQVERQSLKRETSPPIIGSTVRRFRPNVGGELERVFPRDDASRIEDMNNSLGIEAIATLRELGKSPPLMNETYTYEGHYTKLTDAQLAAAHNIYRDFLTITLTPMLNDPTFLELKSTDYAKAKKLVDQFLEKTEAKIKLGVLTPTQRASLHMQ